ncbi:MAG TPA: AMP-binding protein [Pseudolabrys sp.]|nr:AMP-binding protein [Pseudolabrys sp.]
MNLAIALERAGKSCPDQPAVARGPQAVFTYAELAGRVGRLAGALRGTLGLDAGDRVVIAAKNSVHYIEAMYAVWHAGFAVVPANAKLHAAELAYVLEHSQAKACFVSDDLHAAVAAHAPASLQHLIVIDSAEYRRLLQADAITPAACAPDDLAWLFYTSGTTGRPKGAMLTHKVLHTASYAYLAEVDPTAPGDALLHAAPMSHGSGLYIPAAIARPATHVIPESSGFEADEVLGLFERWTNVSMFAAPTMVKRLVDCPRDCDPSRIRTIIWGGAPMYVEDTVRALDRFGPRFAQIYGQGESPMTISTLTKQEIGDRAAPQWRERLASAGRAFACIEVMIADEADRPLPAGETGEILCRGDSVMAGYWRNPEASAATLKDGWLHTGDVGALSADGYLYLKDRSKDLIISGGSNIYPREVEEVLLRHPGVREVSVIGRPDREWGEVVVAYVVGAAKADELDALCLASIARFKRPKDYVFIEALPKNNYGKVLKTELRVRDGAKGKHAG